MKLKLINKIKNSLNKMEKNSTLKEIASPISKWNNVNTANSSPKKRQKVSEENEVCAEFNSDLSIELSSPKFAKKKKKLNLKGETSIKANRQILKKPKKNITAYAFFIKQKKKEYYAANLENVGTTSMMKELGQQWATISEQEKQAFIELAENDRRRYEKEIQNFKEKCGNLKVMKEIESHRPKKALSAYMIFVRETRPIVCERYPQMHALEVMKEVGKAWQSLTSHEKKRFEQSAIVDKQRYHKEVKKFEEQYCDLENLEENIDSQEEIKEEFNNLHLESPSTSKKNPKPKESKINVINCVKSNIKKNSIKCKIAKEDGKPKRPLSAYIYFSQEIREVIKMENYSSTDIMKEVSSRWACLDQESKEVYNLLAAQDKIRFEEEMKAYKQSILNKDDDLKLKIEINDSEHETGKKIQNNLTRRSEINEDKEKISEIENDLKYGNSQNNESDQNFDDDESNSSNECYCTSPKFIIERVPNLNRRSQQEKFEIVKLEQEINDKELKEECYQECALDEQYANVQMENDCYSLKLDNKEYESYDEGSQICSSQIYDLDDEFDDESNCSLPFLNQPRTTYKSLLDYDLEYYLQSRYHAGPYISLQEVVPTL